MDDSDSIEAAEEAIAEWVSDFQCSTTCASEVAGQCSAEEHDAWRGVLERGEEIMRRLLAIAAGRCHAEAPRLRKS